MEREGGIGRGRKKRKGERRQGKGRGDLLGYLSGGVFSYATVIRLRAASR